MFRDTPKIIIDDDDAPSAPYVVNIRMEDLLEKLKILNYDNEFVHELKMKPINRYNSLAFAFIVIIDKYNSFNGFQL